MPGRSDLIGWAVVQVLLMPVSRGANGLNLVEANHVLLGKTHNYRPEVTQKLPTKFWVRADFNPRL
jgi:hypothetical protein